MALSVVPAVSATPKALTEEALVALALADQSVTNARASHTLWTSAVEKLGAARNAAIVFDSDNTLKLSREIVALCARSAAQAKLPPVTW
ncbi:MAG: hypothetical protein WCL29_00285 [Pseudomonadota bacterium]